MANKDWGIYWSGRKSSGVTLTTDRWYHLAVVRKWDTERNQATLHFYTDGNHTGRTYNVGREMKNRKFTIGHQGTGDWWHTGQIDDVAVFRSALEPAQVQALMKHGMHGITTADKQSLVAFYSFDQETPIDSSKNGLDGTLKNGAPNRRCSKEFVLVDIRVPSPWDQKLEGLEQAIRRMMI